MQDSLPAGGLRLYREGVEPSGSLRKVSGYISLLLSRTSPVARKVYANNRPDSVCIRTNLVRIRNCLGKQYRIGVVRYIDFKNKFPDVNFPFLYKRAAFLQENEARIFVRSHDLGPD